MIVLPVVSSRPGFSSILHKCSRVFFTHGYQCRTFWSGIERNVYVEYIALVGKIFMWSKFPDGDIFMYNICPDREIFMPNTCPGLIEIFM